MLHLSHNNNYTAVHVHVIRIKSLLLYDNIHAIRYLLSTINGVNKSLIINYYHHARFPLDTHMLEACKLKVILNIDMHI